MLSEDVVANNINTENLCDTIILSSSTNGDRLLRRAVAVGFYDEDTVTADWQELRSTYPLIVEEIEAKKKLRSGARAPTDLEIDG